MAKKKKAVQKLDEGRFVLQRDYLIHVAAHALHMNPTEIVAIFKCSRPTVYAVLKKEVEL
jgi:hypothetical protein